MTEKTERTERSRRRTKPANRPAGAGKRTKAATRQAAGERPLAEYRSKRDFTRTEEPQGGSRKAGRKLAYVIQKHVQQCLPGVRCVPLQ